MVNKKIVVDVRKLLYKAKRHKKLILILILSLVSVFLIGVAFFISTSQPEPEQTMVEEIKPEEVETETTLEKEETEDVQPQIEETYYQENYYTPQANQSTPTPTPAPVSQPEPAPTPAPTPQPQLTECQQAGLEFLAWEKQNNPRWVDGMKNMLEEYNGDKDYVSKIMAVTIHSTLNDFSRRGILEYNYVECVQESRILEASSIILDNL